MILVKEPLLAEEDFVALQNMFQRGWLSSAGKRVDEFKDARSALVIRAASTTLDIARHTADVTFNLWSLEGDRLIGETHETHQMRYFFPQEFALFLASAGFQLKTLTAFPSLSTELSDQSWNALAVAIAVN